MWLNIVVGVVVIAALLVAALWGIYGDKLIAKLKRLSAGEPDTPPPAAAERKEPRFDGAAAKAQELDLMFQPPELPELDEHWQADFCYVVRFYEQEAQTARRFTSLRDTLLQRNIKIYQVLGFDENIRQWSIAEAADNYRYWILMLPLADRNSSLTQPRIRLIEEDCLKFAEAHKQRAVFPPISSALERTKLLDDVCNTIDVVLKLRVMLKEPLASNDIAELLQRAYLVADNNNQYVYRLESEKLFSAQAVVLPNTMAREISFLLDVPTVSQPQRAFEDMIRCMKEIAELKNGDLYDHQDRRLGETEISIMRGGIETVINKMQEYGVVPGSKLSHLLFS